MRENNQIINNLKKKINFLKKQNRLYFANDNFRFLMLNT